MKQHFFIYGHLKKFLLYIVFPECSFFGYFHILKLDKQKNSHIKNGYFFGFFQHYMMLIVKTDWDTRYYTTSLSSGMKHSMDTDQRADQGGLL